MCGTISPLYIPEMIIHFFEHLSDEEVAKKNLVCKLWRKAVQQVHTTPHRTRFECIIKIMSSDELDVKTAFQKWDPKRCPCTLFKKLSQNQQKEIHILQRPHLEHVKPIPELKVDANHPENFFTNRQNIKDQNLGAALYQRTNFFGKIRTDLLEMGKEAREAILLAINEDLASRFNTSSTAVSYLNEAPFLYNPTIFFDRCGLTEFPSEICLLSKIRKNTLIELNIIKNHISYLPKELNLFPDLEVLDLSENAFQFFPRAILQLKKLKDLDLYKNPLIEIPPEVEQLEALESLDLTFTSITSLPNEIAQLPNLKRINLTASQIQSFSKEIMFCDNQNLVDAMIPHLFGEMVFYLCMNNRQELYELICLLSKEFQIGICSHYHEYNKDFDSGVLSLEDFLNALQKEKELFDISLLIAFMATLLESIVFDSSSVQFWKLWKNLKNDFIQWSPDTFEKERVKFSQNPMKLEVSIPALLSENEELSMSRNNEPYFFKKLSYVNRLNTLRALLHLA